MPPELDRSGQLAAFLEHLADCLGRRFVNAEHDPSMGGRTATGKRQPRRIRNRPRQVLAPVPVSIADLTDRIPVKPHARPNSNTCISRAGCSDGRNDRAPERGKVGTPSAAKAGELCTDWKDEPVDNGVGGTLSATLARDRFASRRKSTRLGQAEKTKDFLRWQRTVSGTVNPACVLRLPVDNGDRRLTRWRGPSNRHLIRWPSQNGRRK
jgi:hypothetical protein